METGRNLKHTRKMSDKPKTPETAVKDSLASPICSGVRSGGMTVEEAKEYLRRRYEETIFGRSWDEISQMQQGPRK
jgi:hypothetical protein